MDHNQMGARATASAIAAAIVNKMYTAHIARVAPLAKRGEPASRQARKLAPRLPIFVPAISFELILSRARERVKAAGSLKILLPAHHELQRSPRNPSDQRQLLSTPGIASPCTQMSPPQ